MNNKNEKGNNKPIEQKKNINVKKEHLDDDIFDKIEEKTLKLDKQNVLKDNSLTKEKKKKVPEKEIIEKKELNANKEDIPKELEEVKKEKEIPEKKIVQDVSDDFEEKKVKTQPKRGLINFFLVIVLLVGLVSFVINLYYSKNSSNLLYTVINSLLLVLFTILFIPISSSSKNKGAICFGSLCLIGYFGFNIITNLSILDLKQFNTIENFSGKNLTEVVSWAEKNGITLNQEYEYSDMISEYKIISQNIKPGTSVKDITSLTVAVSEGPNPSKEIVVPNMITWDDERVIDFVKENYLSNVKVEFVESDKAPDTVIEQDKSGNLKRDEEINLVFSYGEELGYTEVKLIDFTKKSKFEVEFYLKQHHLNYKFEKDFSKKIKRDLAIKQNKKPGTMIKIDDEEVIVTFSRGPEIKVPDLLKMSLTEITEWVIKNKLKLEFSDKYDDSIKENNVIDANHKKGDVIEQGETIKIVISKGSLKMPKFKSYNEFREWADKYEIKYEEKHEFSTSVKAGEVISYSYKTGDAIKNDDVIIVTISDGEAVKVPNLKGLTKNEVISKLEKLGLKYSFVYRYSETVSEGKVINQSISAGSEISENTTITVTISKGESRGESNNNSNNSSSNTGNGSQDESNKTPACDTSKGAELNIQAGNNGSQTKSMIKQLNPNHKFNFVDVDSCENGDSAPGTICTLNLEGVWKNFCDSITIKIVK